jgi:hypothetical protein
VHLRKLKIHCCDVGASGNANCLRAHLLYIHRYLCAKCHKECYQRKITSIQDWRNLPTVVFTYLDVTCEMLIPAAVLFRAVHNASFKKLMEAYQTDNLVLLGNGSVNEFPRQRIHSQQQPPIIKTAELLNAMFSMRSMSYVM